MKTSKLIRISVLFVSVVIGIAFQSCINSSNPNDLKPIIDGRFKDAKAVYYPSTDYKVSAVIVDKNGDVWFIRMNSDNVPVVKDDKILFNVTQYCQ